MINNTARRRVGEGFEDDVALSKVSIQLNSNSVSICLHVMPDWWQRNLRRRDITNPGTQAVAIPKS